METSYETRLDEALFALPEESLGNVGSALGRTRLRTFIMLRWFAVIGQTSAILLVAFGFNFDVNLALCLAIIAASAWLNVTLSFVFPTQRLAREGEAFAQFASDLDASTQQLLARGARLTELLKQAQYSPLKVEEQVVSIFAGVNGYLDGFDVSDVNDFESALLDAVRAKGKKILSTIAKEQKLTEKRNGNSNCR